VALKTVATASGEIFGVINVLAFGAVGNGLANDTAAIQAAFAAAGAKGAVVIVPPGTYLLGSTVVWPITAGFSVQCSEGAIFKGAATMAETDKMFRPTASTGSQSFVWEGGTIDGRLRPAFVSGAPDMLSIATPNIENVTINRVTFISNNTRAGTAGDSILFLAEGEDYRVTNCRFVGAVDAALYVSGNNPQTTGRRLVAYGNTFEQCNVGIISKRRFEDHSIFGNFLLECTFGIVIGGEGDPALMPGYKAVVLGNVLRRCTTSIEARIADGTVIASNRIEDWGIGSDGTTVFATGAITLAGSDKCVVTGNVIVSPNVTQNVNGSGVEINPYSFNATLYQSDYNIIEVNVICDAACGVRESASSNDNTIGGTNRYINCTTEAVRFGITTVNGFKIQGPTPSVYWQDSSAAVDEKIWRATMADGALTLSTRTDVDASGALLFQAWRTGTTITKIISSVAAFPEYANDAAAAAGGLELGGLYRTGSAIKLRVV